MVHVDEGRVGAARHAATASIAGEHGPTQGGWDVLFGAPARRDIGCSGSLRRARVGRGGGGGVRGCIVLSPAVRAHVGVARAVTGRDSVGLALTKPGRARWRPVQAPTLNSACRQGLFSIAS
jgi:hypothetical protein